MPEPMPAVNLRWDYRGDGKFSKVTLVRADGTKQVFVDRQEVEVLVSAAQSVVSFLPTNQQVLDLRDALVPFAEETEGSDG